MAMFLEMELRVCSAVIADALVLMLAMGITPLKQN